MRHLMDLRNGDETNMGPGISRNESMSILDQVYVNELVNDIYARRK